MDGCVCNTIHTLAKGYNEAQVKELVPALNRHLQHLRQFLAQASSLSRHVQYQITPRNQRSEKALFVDKVDLAPIDRVFSRFENDVADFWVGSEDRVHLEEQFSGFLPLDVPASTYERYLSVDDEEVFTHLSSLKPSFENYNELVQRLVLSQLCGPDVVDRIQADGTIAWSLSPERIFSLEEGLAPQTIEVLGITALKLICFVCPMCYEGNTDWSPLVKQQVWPILEKLLKGCKILASLKTQVVEAVLYFCERDSLAIRHVVVKQAKLLLRKSMPYYLHASVVLFGSILYRVDGELAKSEAQIREFLWRGPRPSNRRDHALEGRLHISQMENKIKCYDKDVPLFACKWEAQQPLSTLDMEVTFRLQSTAARYFQSIGDFDAARVSPEELLSLGRIKPIPTNSRRVLLGRLSDVYCEMGEYIKATEILEPELEHINPSDRVRRGFRRLILALVEANIGLKQLDAAESALEELLCDLPPCPDDINDQQLHMRKLLVSARIAHMRLDLGEAIRC
ncbi:mfs multidrug transporter [Fusarium subglutinans]|uniref:Mfs multidrug transporter n=1 Tax=Gibberella subglutinans TaxID=42677 RepID=A0A8H5NZ18_GIBSU|nr:mfs multidrug transporter [Fusarium subglutinans]KAF5583674.1 mfs multidrug transporter [Fusarium subglutinans]